VNSANRALDETIQRPALVMSYPVAKRCRVPQISGFPSRAALGSHGFLALSLAVGWMLIAISSSLLGAESHYVLLRLRWTDTGVQVLESRGVKGPMKPAVNRRGTHQVQLTDGVGKTLWTSSLEDPRLRRYEYPSDAEGSGLAGTTKRLPQAELMLRVPLSEGVREILILGPESPTLAGGVNRRPILLRHPVPSTAVVP